MAGITAGAFIGKLFASDGSCEADFSRSQQVWNGPGGIAEHYLVVHMYRAGLTLYLDMDAARRLETTLREGIRAIEEPVIPGLGA